MSPIRVAHVITRLCTGGAQENTFHTVRLADKGRFQADLFAGRTHGAEGSIESIVENEGIPVRRVDGLRRDPHPWQDLRALRELTADFRDGEYDIVHTHTSKAGFIGRLAARRAGIPVIIHTPHGHIFDGYFPRPVTAFYAALERHAARFTSRIITLTQAEADQHRAQGIGRDGQFVPIFSGIDPRPFQDAAKFRDEVRAEWGLNPDDFAVIAIGRLEPIKGFGYLIKAAARVVNQLPHARFVVIGDGSQRNQLESDAASLGGAVRFLGLRRDIPRLLAGADLLALPSLNEGMGRVLLEAGAAGVPVVASAVGGVPELLAGGRYGVLVPARDAVALADAIVALAGDDERRTAFACAWRDKVIPGVIPGYDLEAMVRRIEEVYEQCLKEARQ